MLYVLHMRRQRNWSFIKAEMYNMPNILSNTLHELLDYSFAASMNFPFVVATAVTLAEYLIS